MKVEFFGFMVYPQFVIALVISIFALLDKALRNESLKGYAIFSIVYIAFVLLLVLYGYEQLGYIVSLVPALLYVILAILIMMGILTPKTLI